MYYLPTLLLLYSAVATAKGVIGVFSGDDDPLKLTPLITSGQADKARNMSTVNPTLFAGVPSYAAFITVNETYKWNTFFWFFPAENKPLESTPWVIWLQGGPGSSSLYGLFTEIGPLQVLNGTVSRMPVTWNTEYSLLFIDNPVNVGFSYSDMDSYMRDEDDVGTSLVSFIQQFVQVFPELQKAPLFIAGESYAGKYVPAFGHYLHHNQKSSFPINLKGLVIADGYTDPPTLLHYSELGQQLGFIEPDEAAELKTYEDAARKAWQEGNIKDFVENEKAALGAFSHLPNVYNYIQDFYDFHSEFEKLLSRTDVKRALHVGQRKYSGAFNPVVEQTFTDDNFITVKPWLEELLEHYGVLCYNGQLDYIVGYALSKYTYLSLKWSGADAYHEAERTPIQSENPDKTLNPIGYKKGAGNFMEVMIRTAGHMAPAD